MRRGDAWRPPPPPLVDRGLGLIYDTELDLTWLQDLNYAQTVGRSRDGQLTWPEAVAWTHSLVYRGVGGWRLPRAGRDAASSELGHLYLGVFREHPGIVQLRHGRVPCIFWTGTEANAEEAYAFDLFTLRQGTLAKDPFAPVELGQVPLSGPVLSWPVHEGDVAAELRARWLRQVFAPFDRFFRR